MESELSSDKFSVHISGIIGMFQYHFVSCYSITLLCGQHYESSRYEVHLYILKSKLCNKSFRGLEMKD